MLSISDLLTVMNIIMKGRYVTMGKFDNIVESAKIAELLGKKEKEKEKKKHVVVWIFAIIGAITAIAAICYAVYRFLNPDYLDDFDDEFDDDFYDEEEEEDDDLYQDESDPIVVPSSAFEEREEVDKVDEETEEAVEENSEDSEEEE